MELKFSGNSTSGNSTVVLIVPLWNWNVRIYNKYLGDYVVLIVPLWNWNTDWGDTFANWGCFNRTFMELKCRCPAAAKLPARSFNRTFMELKFLTSKGYAFSQDVLIVPLWNWNVFTTTICWTKKWVLIVPLWNWNQTLPGTQKVGEGF